MSKNKKNFSKPIDISNLKFSYGIPHCHTSVSTGKASPTEAIEQAYKNGLNFLILTDHNSYFENLTKTNKWENLNKLIQKANKKYTSMIVFQGFEANTSTFGHVNIVNPPNYFLGTVKNINDLIMWCAKDINTLISLNHPNSSIFKLPLSDIYNYFITNIEVANGIYNKKYSKYQNIYYNMLDKGWRLSAINGQDNHKLNIGVEENLTCVITNKFSPFDLIEGLRHHHTFSTESRSLKFFFTINNTFMGDALNIHNESKLSFYICAEDYFRKIITVQIISIGGSLVKEITDLNLHNIKIMYEQKPNLLEKWYVVKIILNDKREALSSPIFIEV